MKCENVSYGTLDGSLIIYYNGKFRGSIESTSMSCSIIDELLNRIEELEQQVDYLKDLPKESMAALELITNTMAKFTSKSWREWDKQWTAPSDIKEE